MCVVTDEVSLTLAANRFSTQPGCPDVLDSLATTLVEDDGVSVQGGAKASARAVAAWTWTSAIPGTCGCRPTVTGASRGHTGLSSGSRAISSE